MDKKQVCILGSTGSVGTQAIEVVRERGFCLTGICADRNISLLEDQIREFHPLFCAVRDENAAKEFGAEIEIDVNRAYGPFNIDENDEIVELAKKAFSNMNIEGKTASTGGGSDTNILNKNGLKAVNLGIGMKKAHTLEEYIAIEDLINSAVMVGEIIKEA